MAAGLVVAVGVGVGVAGAIAYMGVTDDKDDCNAQK